MLYFHCYYKWRPSCSSLPLQTRTTTTGIIKSKVLHLSCEDQVSHTAEVVSMVARPSFYYDCHLFHLCVYLMPSSVLTCSLVFFFFSTQRPLLKTPHSFEHLIKRRNLSSMPALLASRFSHLPPSSFSSEEPSCNNWAFSIPE